MSNSLKIYFVILGILFCSGMNAVSFAQSPFFEFGTSTRMQELMVNGKSAPEALKWFNVNTNKDTWSIHKKGVLSCSGKPTGVVRSEKQYENFIMHVEWKHLEPGGNSGVFAWSSGEPKGGPLPDGIEIQILELDWVKLNTRNGVTPPIAYVHGELFGVGGVETVPDNPRGTRSKSIENRAKGKGEWNTYDLVCVDGVIKLAVNGKFVNGLSKSTRRKGYICLESEGAPIEFRNLKIIELAPGIPLSEQAVLN